MQKNRTGHRSADISIPGDNEFFNKIDPKPSFGTSNEAAPQNGRRRGKRSFVKRLWSVLTANLPTSVSCIWSCNTTGGTCAITIDNSDGLPVELMEFEVTDEETETGDGASEK